ncbi:hypothetical protein GQ53DRAFT_870835 [Thozetella sp. PMI_491]|nr:hypothetical protein GQ53DRAFT_870835 [Thozetella sp. PMI_491]
MAPQAIYDDEPQPAGEKPTVYLLDNFHPAVVEYCQEHFNAILPGSPSHGEWRQKARYLLVRSARLTAEDIESCPNLIALGKQGVGIDKIDAAACAARGIKIFNTPGVNARAVAEIVLSLTMAVARQVGSIVARQTAGTLTIGVLGMGNIGKIAAQIFKGAFDTEIIAFDPYLPTEAWSDLPHTRAKTIEEVLAVSDVVTLHMPLTETTKGLISYPQFQIMKKNAVLINAARGGIVNEADLERALEEGLIWGAGLDCHEQEPPSKEKYGRLWELGVVSTPHVGAATAQTQMETGLVAATRLFQYTQLKEKRNP